MKKKLKCFTKTSIFLLLLCHIDLGFSFQFNKRILESVGFDNVDLSAFAGENDRFSGEYIANISINKDINLYSKSIYLYNDSEINKVCFTSTLIEQLPIKKEVLTLLKKGKKHTTDIGECLLLENLDPNILISFDGNTQTVGIQIPHKFLDNYDPNWVIPKNRDTGISGVVIDYNILSTYNRFKRGALSSSVSEIRSYGTIGANIGKFRLRANYQFSSDMPQDKFDWTQIYGFTDIASWNAKLYAGELYSRSSVFDSARFKGVSIFTDENMMPSYLRGYAPQVTGTATSNAIVTIKQYGNILQSIQVPAGPFAISDLPSYISGIVDVEIEESDGSVKSYQMNISQVPFLTRKGDIRYSINLGHLNPLNKNNKLNTNFLSADASYGLNNNISLYGGVIITSNRDYRALNTGIGLNLESLGAISFDITHSNNSSKNNKKSLTGYSYRVNYAKRFGKNTSLNLAGYRFSSKEFTSLQNYIDMHDNNSSRVSFEKDRVTLSISQVIPNINTTFSLSMTKGSYWNKHKNSSYNISASHSIQKGILENSSVQLSLMRSTNYLGEKDNQIALFINIPLDQDKQSRLQYTNGYYDNDKEMSQQLTYYTDFAGGRTSVGISAQHQRDLSGAIDYNINASYDISTQYGRFTTTGNYSDNNQRYTAGFDGSITLTQHGLATHPRVYENGSRFIVDTEAAGVKIKGMDNSSNMFGLLGVSNLPAYYPLTYTIDNDNLPVDVEIQDSVMKLAVTDGAIAYRNTNTIYGTKSISTISLPDGTHPPFGAIVYRKNHTEVEVAMVANQGLTYLTGLKTNTNYIVKWADDQSCTFSVNSLDTNELQSLICYTK